MRGPNQVFVQNQDGAINGLYAPATPGSTITVYLTGQGLLDVSIPTGSAAPQNPPIGAAASVAARVDKQNAEITFAGMVGIFQVNIRLPSLSPGEYPLVIQVGTSISNSAMLIVGQ